MLSLIIDDKYKIHEGQLILTYDHMGFNIMVFILARATNPKRPVQTHQEN